MVNTIHNFLQAFRTERSNESRKRPSAFGISVFNSLNDVPEHEWKQVVPEHKGLMRHPYLRAIEESSNENEQSRYVIIYKGDAPVAAAVFHIVVLTGENYGSLDDAQSTLERLTNSFRDKAKIRVLVCGHTHISGDHGFIYSGAITHREAYQALADACYKITRTEKPEGKIHLQLIMDFYENEYESSKFLRVFKYHQFKVDPNMILTLKPGWNTFDDYLNAMNKKYRKKALTVVQQAASLERRRLTAEEVRSNADQIQELYLNVANKAKVRINQYDTSYLLQLKLHLKEDFELIGYYKEGEMVGFSTVILWGDNCEGHAIGMNYEVNNEYSLYLNILYDFVKISLEKKKTALILGRTAMEMKSNIGAEPYDMYCYVRHTGPLMNRAFKPVLNYIKQTEWTQRSPFKDQKEGEN